MSDTSPTPETANDEDGSTSDPADVAKQTGGTMAYDEVDGLDRDAIGRGEVGDA